MFSAELERHIAFGLKDNSDLERTIVKTGFRELIFNQTTGPLCHANVPQGIPHGYLILAEALTAF